jgi:hypothetical protein
MVNKNENSLNDCQENWHNNNNFFCIFEGYLFCGRGRPRRYTHANNKLYYKNINEKAIITTHCHGSCVAADGSTC